MMRLQLLGVMLGIAIAGTPAAAQDGAPAKTGDIVVTGVRAKLSGWREAETDHIILVGDGSESELVQTARNLERLHWLLDGLFDRSNAVDDTVKIRITLIGDTADFSAMDLQNKRWQQGPFNERFEISRYYDPREDGTVMATTRVDQRTVVERTTLNARSIQGVVGSLAAATAGVNTGTQDPGGAGTASALALQSAVVGDFATTGLRGPHDLTTTVNANAIEISAASLVYAGYAQHYLLTYFPAAYPRWYLDGFGQIFSSFSLKGSNQLTFGRSPSGAGAVLDEFGGYPLSKIFDDSYLSADPRKTGWTPIHAWMLTHFLLFSDTRRPQLNRYLALRANGADAATAAAVFGDQKQLAAELKKYLYARKPFEQITYTPAKDDAPLVRRLTEGQAAFVQGRLELGARVLIPAAPSPGTPEALAQRIAKARDQALSRRESWLADLRGTAARWPRELGAQLLLAEAECRSEHGAECLAAADRAHAIAPGAADPLAWRGMAFVLQAAAASPDEKGGLIAQARTAIAAANRIDQNAVAPLLAYYASYTAVGDAPSPKALDAMQKVMLEVPNAPAPRLKLATGLAAAGNDTAARQVILPVAAGAYDSPERLPARALLAQTGTATATDPVKD